ncbi:hypothetical protein E2562_002202 [Oryza meyeriana var. granulata]|uniref:Uncharacterized protein n=1 Tax=Oryza meyeriana var. granulata TaxID=110450 RepID=A0A6G1EF01_9ORYZ|nr:hypothetical protein E2562_002202 [Oryza meyeriana var. granulata]
MGASGRIGLWSGPKPHVEHTSIVDHMVIYMGHIMLLSEGSPSELFRAIQGEWMCWQEAGCLGWLFPVAI